MKLEGVLIAFEGVDGTGKTSLARECVKIIGEAGICAEFVTFPGQEASSFGEFVYRLHHDPSSAGIASITPTALQVAHIAAHIDMIQRRIIPALSAGKCVVLDRFWWSTWVYGIESGVYPRVLESLIEAELQIWGAIRPGLLIYVTRSKPLKSEPIEKWTDLRRAYDELAGEANQFPVKRIENDGDFRLSVERVRGFLIE